MKEELTLKLIHKDTKKGRKIQCSQLITHTHTISTPKPTHISRREGDSNPRIPYEINGFRDRPVRPLWHLSEQGMNLGLV